MAAPKINSAIGGKELIEKVNQIIDNTQDKLPNASASGKILKSTNTTGGVEWGDVDGLPSQSGQSGKFLTTNGTTASWGGYTAGEGILISGGTISISLQPAETQEF